MRTARHQVASRGETAGGRFSSLQKPRWLVAAFVLLSLASFELRLDTGGDNAVYLLLGESLATGHGYAEIWRPVTVPHTQYPPGFPVLIMLVTLVFGAGAIVPMKLLVLTLGAAAFAICLILYRRTAPGEHWPAVLLLATPLLPSFGSRILTEVPFLLLSGSALALLLGCEDRRGLRAWMAIALVLVTLLVRASGIALVLAAAATCASKRRWAHLAALVVGAGMLLLAWQLRSAELGGQSYLQSLLARDPYVNEFGRVNPLEFAGRVGRNALRYVFTLVPEALLPAASVPGLREVVGTLVAGLVALGLLSRMQSVSVLEFYAAASGLVLVAWPEVWSGDRFLLPLLPLVMLYLWIGLRLLAERLRRPVLARVAAGLITVVNLAYIGAGTPRRVVDNLAWLRGDRLAGYDPDWKSYFRAIEWLAENSGDSDVVIARKPEYVYLLGRRRAACYPFTNDRAAVLAAVRQADWIIFDNFRWTKTTQYFLNPVLQDDPGLFRAAYTTSWPQFFVLKVLR